VTSHANEPHGGAADRTVSVHVRYLSAVREKTGTRADELRLPAGSTLETLSGWLKNMYALTVQGPDLMSTLNGYGWSQVPEGLATELREGDEIALFPLLSGG
jgi:molybdopterin converting factor small subunit